MSQTITPEAAERLVIMMANIFFTSKPAIAKGEKDKGSKRAEEKKKARALKEDTPDEEEAIYRCCVDMCGKLAPLSKMEFLPKDNVLEALGMILSCKTSVHEQNMLIQRYLEARYLYKRPDWRTAKEWPRGIPFRICHRHFNMTGAPINLPRPVPPAWRHLVDLIYRENLFYMYGVDSNVEYPSDADRSGGDAVAKQVALRTYCNIPGCYSNLIEVDPATGVNVRLYPVPIDDSIRHMWTTSISHSLTIPFDLAFAGFICEKHFVRGGRVINGLMELPTLFDQAVRIRLADQLTLQATSVTNPQKVRLMPADREARDPTTRRCMVRCCPVTSKSLKRKQEAYRLFQLPMGAFGERWLRALRNADVKFELRPFEEYFVCERHFSFGDALTEGAASMRPSIPNLNLTPFEAAINALPSTERMSEERCICCRDVEECSQILRRFNTKMNTLMQHVNMLCVLEGVKEVIPRPFNDHDDDMDLYGDPEKVAVLAGVRAASMFVREAKGELATMSKTLNSMGSTARRMCAIASCIGSSKQCRMVDQKTFEREVQSGELVFKFATDVMNVRRLFAKSNQPIAICQKHAQLVYEDDCDDDEEATRMKQVLALPVDFQPKYGKRRRMNEEEGEQGEGPSVKVKVEVHDDEEEDDRILSNNELLQRLLGGAIAGQVTGEIGDNGDVYEGGEEEAEMDELDHQEPATEDEEGEEEREEEEADEDSHEEPPELD